MDGLAERPSAVADERRSGAQRVSLDGTVGREAWEAKGWEAKGWEPSPSGRHSGRGPNVLLAVALLGRANLTGLVLGCIDAKFCKKRCV